MFYAERRMSPCFFCEDLAARINLNLSVLYFFPPIVYPLEVTIVRRCLLFVIVVTSDLSEHAGGAGPNILLIFADDVGTDAIGCYGGAVASNTSHRLHRQRRYQVQSLLCDACLSSFSNLLDDRQVPFSIWRCWQALGGVSGGSGKRDHFP